jgi:lysophospholipase L1-like esterase
MAVPINFLNKVNIATNPNRKIVAISKSICFVGDSNTAGQISPVTVNTRFSKLVSDALGYTEVNVGINGTTMSSSNSGGAGNSWVSWPYTYTATGSGIMVIGLGTNDDRLTSNLAQYEIDYDTFLTDQFKLGYVPGNILMMSVAQANDSLSSQTRQFTINASIHKLAAKYGCKYVDIYSPLPANVTNFTDDATGHYLHFSIAGHAIIAGLLLQTLGY